ncbi:Protein CBG12280 [Caenorhabditis briggsae]|uniref:Protein CBG12280 n=1 Tax=Caenorhabditis briggsae TaxID=6238 RepID=A8XF60_CAEBR|nr:Protein CBG12280 [Caenorhabditis briggsae]CAP31282.2 Protein CBG12280 [Caenorhabditis briggsae]
MYSKLKFGMFLVFWSRKMIIIIFLSIISSVIRMRWTFIQSGNLRNRTAVPIRFPDYRLVPKFDPPKKKGIHEDKKLENQKGKNKKNDGKKMPEKKTSDDGKKEDVNGVGESSEEVIPQDLSISRKRVFKKSSISFSSLIFLEVLIFEKKNQKFQNK